MSRRSRFLLAVFLVAAAIGLRGPWLHRELWNLDEGVTFTMAQQVVAGDVVYRDAADHRGPLVPYLKAAVFAIAGNWNTFAVHLVVAFAMGGVALLLWGMARRLGDEPAGVAAALVFTALSFTLLDFADAIAAHTGWFVVIFSAAGFAFFVHGLGRPRFRSGCLAGLCFGASAACKQPGILDLGAAWVVLALVSIERVETRKALLKLGLGTVAGAAVIPVTFVAYFAAHGAFHDFVYYAFTYNTRIYVPEVPFWERWAAMQAPFELAWAHAPALAILGVAGGVGALVSVIRGLRRTPRTFPVLPWLILSWTGAGIVSTGLSGRTFSHYSAQVVPGLSLACGWAIARVLAFFKARPSFTRKAWAGIVAVLAVVLGIACLRRAREFRGDVASETAAGHVIAGFSRKSERIFVWGYFPELYCLSHRLPATRFLYANFLTGLIPWTNLDPLRDTHYAVVPKAWEQLEEDFARHPPALIVDTGNARGYVKYPLHDQPFLWNLIRKDFAQVADDYGARIFRRIEYADGAALDGSLPRSTAIDLSGVDVPTYNEPPRLRVKAPAGASRVELYAGGKRIALIEHPTDRIVNSFFFLDADNPANEDVHAVVTAHGARTVSRAFNYTAYAKKRAAQAMPGPRLHVGRLALAPESINSVFGAIKPSPEQPDTWRIDAPEELSYPCPEGLGSIEFVHGLYPAAFSKSDGYDLLVELRTKGRTQLLHQHRVEPRRVPGDRALQKVFLSLPAHPDGRLVFQFLAGRESQPDFDWIYFGQMQGAAQGPLLLMGEQAVFPVIGAMGENEPMKQNPAGQWLAHAPARVEWPLPPGLAALTLRYGIEEGAFTAKDGHSDGVDITLETVDGHGSVHPLFSRSLTPFNHAEQRGSQSSRVEIPRGLAGKLVLRIGPGPRGDASWDWAWLGEITCEGPGPTIEGAKGRAIMPFSSHVVNANGDYSKRNDESHWGAHADAALVYDRPADLASVTFRYGLADGAARDEAGKQRSDGVDVLVEFQSSRGTPMEVFRRHLDPFHRPSDAGEQISTVRLPSYEAGKLTFRLTPGSSGNNAFDWGFWGRFEGEFVQ